MYRFVATHCKQLAHARHPNQAKESRRDGGKTRADGPEIVWAFVEDAHEGEFMQVL